jgi:hypothetical protein
VPQAAFCRRGASVQAQCLSAHAVDGALLPLSCCRDERELVLRFQPPQRSSSAHERGSDCTWPVPGETPQAAPAARLLEQLKAESDEASSVTSAPPKHEPDAPRGWRGVRAAPAAKGTSRTRLVTGRRSGIRPPSLAGALAPQPVSLSPSALLLHHSGLRTCSSSPHLLPCFFLASSTSPRARLSRLCCAPPGPRTRPAVSTLFASPRSAAAPPQQCAPPPRCCSQRLSSSPARPAHRTATRRPLARSPPTTDRAHVCSSATVSGAEPGGCCGGSSEGLEEWQGARVQTG